MASRSQAKKFSAFDGKLIDWDDPLFWRRVNRTDTCWLWEGTKNQDGYGMVSRRRLGQLMMAHRYAFLLTFRRFPVNELHHLCKTPACVRPDHLQEVTRQEHAKEWRQPFAKCGHAFDATFPSGKYLARRCSQCYAVYDKSPQRRLSKLLANRRAAAKRRLAMLYSEAT